MTDNFSTNSLWASVLYLLATTTFSGLTFAQENLPATTTEQDAAQTVKLSPLSAQLQSALARGLVEVKGSANAERFEGIVAYYRKNNFKPVWINNLLPTQKARDVVEILRNASDHGLQPEDYDAEALYQKLGARNQETLADLEIQLSRSVVAYAQHLNAGRLNPQSVNQEIVVFPKVVASGTILEKLSATSRIQVYLRLLAPHTPRYERLRTAMLKYKTIARNGGWTTIEEGDVLKPGMSDPRVPALRARMIEDGSLEPTEAQGDTYDKVLEAAVKQFQSTLGLEPDGVIGPQTLKQLNIPVEERIRTMEINLERRRWMQNDYGRYYVFANLADQVVKLVRDEKTLHAELIQVGKPYFRTPVFSDTMDYIVINPFWNVPYSIATREYLPKLKTNPGILKAENMKVLKGGKIINPATVPWSSYSRKNFPVRLRQDSGPGNALGRIKFMFPNKFNVYIHDTPSKSNFNKASRYFSHGCLRLRDPLTMAEKILGQQGWTRQKIDRVVKSGKRTVVNLKQKIPVHVTYLTSWVNKDGSVHFRRDIYGRDKILNQALLKAGAH